MRSGELFRATDLVRVIYHYRPEGNFWVELHPSDERRLRDIVRGGTETVSLPVADRILTQLGLHIWMLDPPTG